MITRAEAKNIAEKVLADSEQFEGVSQVLLWGELTYRQPVIYSSGDRIEDCWIAYASRKLVLSTRSTIVAIHRETGEVVYQGPAHDEG